MTTIRELLADICDAQAKLDLVRLSTLCEHARERLKVVYIPEADDPEPPPRKVIQIAAAQQPGYRPELYALDSTGAIWERRSKVREWSDGWAKVTSAPWDDLQKKVSE